MNRWMNGWTNEWKNGKIMLLSTPLPCGEVIQQVWLNSAQGLGGDTMMDEWADGQIGK